MKRAAIYCRVSTIHHGQSVDMQLHDLRKLAEQRGFQIVQEYSDQGISGSKSSRPALDALLADAKRGKFQILLTWRLDRLGRSTAHLIHLLEDLKNSGVELISFSEGLDFSLLLIEKLQRSPSHISGDVAFSVSRFKVCGLHERIDGYNFKGVFLLGDAHTVTYRRCGPAIFSNHFVLPDIRKISPSTSGGWSGG